MQGVRLKDRLNTHLLQLTLLGYFLLTGLSPSQADTPSCLAEDGKVTRAMFTTQIENREPVNRVLLLENKIRQIIFFTDLRHMEGQDIVHRWEHEGHVIAEKVFNVKGPRWRVYSTQDLDASMLGRWTVVVADKQGCPLKAVVFQYVESAPNGEGSAIIELKQ